MSNAMDMGFINGIFVPDSSPNLSLLQFTDDTLIFIPADLEQVKNLKRVLHCFELISGLKINFSKSSLVDLKADRDCLSSTVVCMGCKTDSLPIKYLGLPLTNKGLSTADWNLVISRVQQRLSICAAIFGKLYETFSLEWKGCREIFIKGFMEVDLLTLGKWRFISKTSKIAK